MVWIAGSRMTGRGARDPGRVADGSVTGVDQCPKTATPTALPTVRANIVAPVVTRATPTDRRWAAITEGRHGEAEADAHDEAGQREVKKRGVAVDGEQQERPAGPKAAPSTIVARSRSSGRGGRRWRPTAASRG